MRIQHADVDHPAYGVTLLEIEFVDCEDGGRWEHTIPIEHSDHRKQQEGQREFSRLCAALGIHSVSDTSDLLNGELIVNRTAKPDAGRYVPNNENSEAA